MGWSFDLKIWYDNNTLKPNKLVCFSKYSNETLTARNLIIANFNWLNNARYQACFSAVAQKKIPFNVSRHSRQITNWTELKIFTFHPYFKFNYRQISIHFHDYTAGDMRTASRNSSQRSSLGGSSRRQSGSLLAPPKGPGEPIYDT